VTLKVAVGPYVSEYRNLAALQSCNNEEGVARRNGTLTESIRLYRGTDMAESEPVTWRLAPGYLAAGKVNLVVGDEGIGKSLWTIRAIASITTGKPWGPFTIASDPADVILIAIEDGWSDTIRPRLEVADADLDRVYVFCESTSSVPRYRRLRAHPRMTAPWHD
jgi:hypothetical protein